MVNELGFTTNTFDINKSIGNRNFVPNYTSNLLGQPVSSTGLYVPGAYDVTRISNTAPTNTTGLMGNLNSFFGSDTFKGLQGLGELALGGLQAYSGLQNYRLGKQALGLANQQFGFQKGLANRNLANQAKVINNTYDNAAQVAAGMIGGGSYNPATDTQGSFGMVDQATVDQYAKMAKEKHVDGSHI